MYHTQAWAPRRRRFPGMSNGRRHNGSSLAMARAFDVCRRQSSASVDIYCLDIYCLVEALGHKLSWDACVSRVTRNLILNLDQFVSLVRPFTFVDLPS